MALQSSDGRTVSERPFCYFKAHKNIFEEGELPREGNVQILHVANSDKPVEFYNLDVIISVGYRGKSKRGTQFRIWVTGILKEYMRKGFALDDERLKKLGGGGYFKELLERIRDIRASEKVFYRQILEIVVAKNYLNEKELRAMGLLVSGYMDFAERQAEREQAMTMMDWVKHLDRILTMGGEQLLSGNGSVTHEQAVEKATGEYKKYKERTLSDVEEDYFNAIKILEKEAVIKAASKHLGMN